MRGERTGLKTRILEQNEKAIYVHCYGHSLNLAIQDAVRSVHLVKIMLDTTHELIKLVKDSPKREEQLRQLKLSLHSTTGGIRTLCPTRYAFFILIAYTALFHGLTITYNNIYNVSRNQQYFM